MEKTEQTARVRAVREYLEGIGQTVSMTQGYEILARALGHRNKHVLAAATPAAEAPIPGATFPAVTVDGQVLAKMLVGDDALSVEQMRALNWEFDMVVPLEISVIQEGQEAMNDTVSERITGNDCALEDIGMRHLPGIPYEEGWLAYRVTGRVSDPAVFFPEQSDHEDDKFYADLLEFARLLGRSKSLAVTIGGFVYQASVAGIGSYWLSVLKEYAQKKGSTNARINEDGREVVAILQVASHLDPFSLKLQDLKYATKVGDKVFSVQDAKGQVALLSF